MPDTYKVKVGKNYTYVTLEDYAYAAGTSLALGGAIYQAGGVLRVDSTDIGNNTASSRADSFASGRKNTSYPNVAYAKSYARGGGVYHNYQGAGQDAYFGDDANVYVYDNTASAEAYASAFGHLPTKDKIEGIYGYSDAYAASTAEADGGGIYTTDGLLFVDPTQFDSNSAFALALGIGYGTETGEGNGTSVARGGGLYHGAGYLHIVDTDFNSNDALSIGVGVGLGFGADGSGGRGIGSGFGAGGGLAQAYYLGNGLGNAGDYYYYYKYSPAMGSGGPYYKGTGDGTYSGLYKYTGPYSGQYKYTYLYEAILDNVSFYDNAARGFGGGFGIGNLSQEVSDVLQFGINSIIPLGIDIPYGGDGNGYAVAHGEAHGGGAYLGGGDVLVENSSFAEPPDHGVYPYGNRADAGAVALAFGKDARAYAGDPAAHKADYFMKTGSQYNGHDIYMYYTVSPIDAGALATGGGLYQATGDLVVVDTPFVGNQATAFADSLAVGYDYAYALSDSQARGGAIYQGAGETTISGQDTYFGFNQAVAGRAIPEWVNSIFATLGGSAPLDYILPFPTLAWAGTVDANGHAIARAYSDATGGAIHQDGDLTLSENIDFLYNQAEGHAYALGTGLDFQIYAGGIPG